MLGCVFFKKKNLCLLFAIFLFSFQLEAAIEVKGNDLQLDVELSGKRKFKDQVFWFEIEFDYPLRNTSANESLVVFLKECVKKRQDAFTVCRTGFDAGCDRKLSLSFCERRGNNLVFIIKIPRESQVMGMDGAGYVIDVVHSVIKAVEAEIEEDEGRYSEEKDAFYAIWRQYSDEFEPSITTEKHKDSLESSKKQKSSRKRRGEVSSTADVPKPKSPRVSSTKKRKAVKPQKGKKRSRKKVVCRKEGFEDKIKLPCTQDIKFSHQVNLASESYWVESEAAEDLILTPCKCPAITISAVSPSVFSGREKLEDDDIPETMSRTDFSMFAHLGNALKRPVGRAQFIAGQGRYYPWVLSQMEKIVSTQNTLYQPDLDDAKLRSELLDWAFFETGFNWRKIPLERRTRKGWSWCMPWMSRQVFGQHPVIVMNQYYNFKQQEKGTLTDFDFYCACPEAYIWLRCFSECKDFIECDLSEEQYLHICRFLNKAVVDSGADNILWSNLTNIQIQEARLEPEDIAGLLRDFKSVVSEVGSNEEKKSEVLKTATMVLESAKLMSDFTGGPEFIEELETLLQYLSSVIMVSIDSFDQLPHRFKTVCEDIRKCYSGYSHEADTVAMCEEVLQVIRGGNITIGKAFSQESYTRLFCMMLYCAETAQDLTVGFLLEKNEEAFEQIFSTQGALLDDEKYTALGCDMEQIIKCVKTVYPETVGRY
ncbi:hypothetical protein ACWJJH_05825 [Endozoicomonadaceae bacterium StTr2]